MKWFASTPLRQKRDFIAEAQREQRKAVGTTSSTENVAFAASIFHKTIQTKEIFLRGKQCLTHSHLLHRIRF